MATAVLALCLTAGALAGCGSDVPPGQAVPALSQRLSSVDDAIASGDPDEARDAVQALIDETNRAHGAGRLDKTEASNIIRAAEALLQELGQDQQVPTETADATPPAESTATPSGDEQHGDEAEDQEGNDDDDDEDED